MAIAPPIAAAATDKGSAFCTPAPSLPLPVVVVAAPDCAAVFELAVSSAIEFAVSVIGPVVVVAVPPAALLVAAVGATPGKNSSLHFSGT